MSVEEELLRRLRDGLPEAEAPELLRRVKEERARRMAPAKNPHKFEDQHAQKLSDLWFSQRETATVEQKNAVGLAYISKVLGLGSKVARRFAEGDNHAYHEVGMKQAGIPSSTDVSGFWKTMRRIFPGVYSDDDISFLNSEGGVVAVLHFQWQLEVPLAEKSPLLGALRANAHVYK